MELRYYLVPLICGVIAKNIPRLTLPFMEVMVWRVCDKLRNDRMRTSNANDHMIIHDRTHNIISRRASSDFSLWPKRQKCIIKISINASANERWDTGAAQTQFNQRCQTLLALMELFACRTGRI